MRKRWQQGVTGMERKEGEEMGKGGKEKEEKKYKNSE